MREELLGAGYEEAHAGPAALIIINTCTVTHKADTDSRRLIRLARKENPGARIIVTGCYAELDRSNIETLVDGVIVVKNNEKDKILQYLYASCDSDVGARHDVPLRGITAFKDRARAFVKVQDGCDNFCSYCKVPLVRGRSRSRDASPVVKEIDGLVKNGYKEIILCGICLGDWGRPSGLNIVSLLT